MPFSAVTLRALRDLAEDPVKIVINGSAFHDWFEIDMDSDIFVPADGWSLTGLLPDARFLGLFREGVSADVYVGNDRSMVGVIDQVEYQIGNNARFTLSGRDKGAYLVDSEAKAERFSNYTLESLAKHILQPEWGIREVIVSNEDNRKVLLGKKEKERFKPGKKRASDIGQKTSRPHTQIDPGQTVAHILDEHCKRHGVIWWMTVYGQLFIGRPQYQQDPLFHFNCYAPGSSDRKKNNVMSATVKRTISDRYTEITVVGESRADKSGKPHVFDGTTTKEKQAHKYRGSATDPDLVKRGIKRRLIITDNDALSNEMCESKAREDMEKRRLSGLVINVTVDGFKQDGRLFTPDTIANVKIEEAGIEGQFWISQRRFKEESRQRRTHLTLHEKGVYLP